MTAAKANSMINKVRSCVFRNISADVVNTLTMATSKPTP